MVKLYPRMRVMDDTMHEPRKYIHHCNGTNLAFFYSGFPSLLLLCCWGSGGKSQPAHNQRASQLIHTSGFEPFFAFLHSPPEHPRFSSIHFSFLCTMATFVVEHLDPELGPWSALEYACIARESHAAGARFLLSSVSPSLQLPPDLASTQGLQVDQRGVEEIFADRKSKVCLLDPAAQDELSPADGEQFEVFLFGGILGVFLSWLSSFWLPG